MAGQVGSPSPDLAGNKNCSLHMTFDLQAFGVGALEDEDEDIYHRDSMSTYDTVLGGEEPGDGLFGWTAPEQYSKKTGGALR